MDIHTYLGATPGELSFSKGVLRGASVSCLEVRAAAKPGARGKGKGGPGGATREEKKSPCRK